MTIGTRILQAREESGLSQRQVAGDHMTRNMLSSLEHDKAKPSLDTLCYLSRVLEKPVGWFLGEDGPQIRGLDRFRAARECYDLGSWRECLDHLSQIPEDEVLGREAALLGILARLELGEQCLSDGRLPYARELAEQVLALECPYFTPELRRRAAMLLAKAENRPGRLAEAVERIPADDLLLLKAQCALDQGRHSDALRYLQALDDRGPEWEFRMGEAWFGLQDHEKALPHYHAAEKTMESAVRRKLELCYAALKNFEQAYRYATMGDRV